MSAKPRRQCCNNPLCRRAKLRAISGSRGQSEVDYNLRRRLRWPKNSILVWSLNTLIIRFCNGHLMVSQQQLVRFTLSNYIWQASLLPNFRDISRPLATAAEIMSKTVIGTKFMAHSPLSRSDPLCAVIIQKSVTEVARSFPFVVPPKSLVLGNTRKTYYSFESVTLFACTPWKNTFDRNLSNFLPEDYTKIFQQLISIWEAEL